MGVPVRHIVCVCVGRCDIGLCSCTRYRFVFMAACKRLQLSVNVATLIGACLRQPLTPADSSSLTPPFLGINNNSLTPLYFFSGRTLPPSNGLGLIPSSAVRLGLIPPSAVRLGLIPPSAVRLGLIPSSAVRLDLIPSSAVRLGLIPHRWSGWVSSPHRWSCWVSSPHREPSSVSSPHQRKISELKQISITKCSRLVFQSGSVRST